MRLNINTKKRQEEIYIRGRNRKPAVRENHKNRYDFLFSKSAQTIVDLPFIFFLNQGKVPNAYRVTRVIRLCRTLPPQGIPTKKLSLIRLTTRAPNALRFLQGTRALLLTCYLTLCSAVPHLFVQSNY